LITAALAPTGLPPPAGLAPTAPATKQERFYVHGLHIAAHSPTGSPTLLRGQRTLSSAHANTSIDARRGSPLHGRKRSPIRPDVADLWTFGLGSPWQRNGIEHSSPASAVAQSPPVSPLNARSTSHSPTMATYRVAENGKLASSPFQRRRQAPQGEDLGSARVLGRMPSPLIHFVKGGPSRANSRVGVLAAMGESASCGFLGASRLPPLGAHGGTSPFCLIASASDGFFQGGSSNAMCSASPPTPSSLAWNHSNMTVSGSSLHPRFGNRCKGRQLVAD